MLWHVTHMEHAVYHVALMLVELAPHVTWTWAWWLAVAALVAVYVGVPLSTYRNKPIPSHDDSWMLDPEHN